MDLGGQVIDVYKLYKMTRAASMCHGECFVDVCVNPDALVRRNGNPMRWPVRC